MITTVSSNAGLTSALSSASAGDTILLAPGSYSQIAIYNQSFSGVTIASADPTRMAQVQGIVLNGVKGLTFSDLAVRVAADGHGVNAANSSNVSFDGLKVTGQGYLAGGLGFVIRTSSGVSVTDSEVSQVWGGIDHRDSSGLTFSGNSLHDLRGDAIRGGGSSNMTITHNEITNVFPYDSHTDVIQFWGTAAHPTMSDITISENVYVRGTGGPIQGIFVTDGSYENMNIHDNAIVGGLWNGIVLNGVSNSVLEDNLVQAYTDQGSYIALGKTNNVQALDNETTGFLLKPEWGTSVNLTQQGTIKIPNAPVGDLTYLHNWEATHITEDGSTPSAPTQPAPSEPPAAPTEPSTTTEISINAGGAGVSAGGATYVPDQYSNGGAVYSVSSPIANTTDDAVYQNVRYGSNFGYAVPLANGDYQVKLKFAETYFNAGGKRVFDVKAEGGLVVDDLDVWKAAGGQNVAKDVVVPVTVKDGVLNLQFISSVDNALVSGIQVTPASATAPTAPTAPTGTSLALNTGGPATSPGDVDYLADQYFTGGAVYKVSAGIANTTDDAVYQTLRYGPNFSYAVPVANGAYDLKLQFAETYFNGAGRRIFDVKAEGGLVVDNLDVWKAAGGQNVAKDVVVPVTVQDGVLNLQFISSVNNAVINGIELTPRAPTDSVAIDPALQNLSSAQPAGQFLL